VGAFLAAKDFFLDFLSRFLVTKCPKTRLKKSSKTTEGGERKNGENKSHIFGDEP
jgi:hypothetical protein